MELRPERSRKRNHNDIQNALEENPDRVKVLLNWASCERSKGDEGKPDLEMNGP